MAFVSIKTKINFALLGVKKLRDVLVPPACPICTRVVAADDGLCAVCWADLDFITAPVCRVSGMPLAVDLGEDTISVLARVNPPPYDMARAAFIYSGSAAALIKKIKFGDRPELARWLAQFMVQAGGDVLPPDALLIPVPLHRRRLVWRRFNQAAELCRAMSAITGHEIAYQAVHRVKSTRQQIGLTRAGRKRNLKGAFRVPKDMAAHIKGRNLVLVDDVLTTGATVETLTDVLRRAGAAQIYVLTLARVKVPEQVVVS